MRKGCVVDQLTKRTFRPSILTVERGFLAAVTTGWIGLFGGLGIVKFWRFHAHAFDLGIFAQGTWLLSRFKDPFVTIRGLSIFADHSSYILVFLVPIYWLFPTPASLIAVTVVAMALTAPLGFAVARTAGAGRPLAGVTALLVLLSPAVQWQVWDSFHPEVLVVPLIVGSIALLQKDRDGWAIALIAIALTAKEDVGLLVVPLGIAIALIMGKRRTGVVVAGVGTAAFVLNFLVILPALSPTGELLYSYRYAQLGSTPFDILVGLATKQSAWWDVVTDPDRVAYVAALVFAMPLALLATRWLLIGIPALAANVFTSHAYQYEIEYHYTAYLIAAVVIAAAFGAARVQRWDRRRLTSALVAVAVIGASVTWGLAGPKAAWAAANADQGRAREILSEIPPGEPVSAWTTLVPHLASRELVYLFPNPWQELSYGPIGEYGLDGSDVPDTSEIRWVFLRTDSYDDYDALIDELRTSGDFEVAVDDPPFLLLQRLG